MMDDQAIQTLLKRADATDGGPSLDRGLADRVTATVRRRQRARFATRSALAAVVLAIGAWAGVITLRSDRKERVAPPVAVAATTANHAPQDLADLTLAADLRAETVERLIERERRMRRIAELESRLADLRARQPLIDPVAEQIERAAILSVVSADALARHEDTRDEALARYREVIDSYPDTYAADVARQRLRELGRMGVAKEMNA